MVRTSVHVTAGTAGLTEHSLPNVEKNHYRAAYPCRLSTTMGVGPGTSP